MPVKKVIIKKKINGEVTDVYPATSADQVIFIDPRKTQENKEEETKQD